MVAQSLGKSHAEKVTNAQATESWKNQGMRIAQLESAYEFEKTKFEVLSKEYQALYLSLKIDSETMRKS